MDLRMKTGQVHSNETVLTRKFVLSLSILGFVNVPCKNRVMSDPVRLQMFL